MAALAALLPACAPDRPDCAHALDCGEDEVCVDGRCRPRVIDCESIYDCPEGSICFGGVCRDPSVVGGCASDEDCGPNETCNPLNGKCVPTQRRCTHSADCEDGERCEGGFCVSSATECATDADCERPLICGGAVGCVPGCEITGCGDGLVCDVYTGRCVVDVIPCVTDIDCQPPWTVCEPPECVLGCMATGCPEGFECHQESGRCIEEIVPECSTDQDCEPPQSVCEPPDCVPGCIAMGCLDGYQCEPSTGRCRADTAPSCAGDSDCEPPQTVCEAGDCVPGCIAMGCLVGMACDPNTGRCYAEPTEPCLADSDCEPPSTICEAGDCVEGCPTMGCEDGWGCVEETGRCAREDTGLLPRGADCEDPLEPGRPDHEACQVDHCVSTGGDLICAEPCSNAMQCPDYYACESTVPDGSMVCLDVPGLGNAPPGDHCWQGTTCKSGWCLNDTCTDVCQHDRDCASLAGSVCRFFFGDWGGGAEMITACGLPNYYGSMGVTGDSCWTDDDCLRNNCTGSGRCSDACHTSFDCPYGYVCNSIGYWNSYRRGCVFAGQATGHGGVGTPCDPSAPSACRSLWCLELTAPPGDGVCIDTCGSQSDCPADYRCEIVPLDATGDGHPNLQFPLCLPR